MAAAGSERGGKGHRFGGDWTDVKLDIVRRYLESYTTALKNQPFLTGYIDAFAGTGYRTERSGKPDDASAQLSFPDLAKPEAQRLLDGSARLALSVKPGFDRYVFVEQSAERCGALESLRDDFPGRDIKVQKGDANEIIRDLCLKAPIIC